MSSRYVIQIGMRDVPHLDQKAIEEILAGAMPHERDARLYGTPSLGSGAIYPIPLDDVLVDPFPIPPHWRRCYGLDVGWNKTAAVWLAQDPHGLTVYVIGEYYRGQADPAVHATAINLRGAWIPGVIDPAADASSQRDGEKLLELYRASGLNLTKANNDVEAGLYKAWSMLSTGQLKVFRTCRHLQDEYRMYQRDERGRVVKRNDHLMDAWRYAVFSGLELAVPEPASRPKMASMSTSIADHTAGY